MRMGSRALAGITLRGLGGGVSITCSCVRGRIGASGPPTCIFYAVHGFIQCIFQT